MFDNERSKLKPMRKSNSATAAALRTTQMVRIVNNRKRAL